MRTLKEERTVNAGALGGVGLRNGRAVGGGVDWGGVGHFLCQMRVRKRGREGGEDEMQFKYPLFTQIRRLYVTWTSLLDH